MDNQANQSEATIPYRADIEGLRALAVTFVILYHFRFGCPGGYVGVDVFFVISGFLITGIIARQIEAGRFSPGQFYARRIRRLFPASFTVAFVSLAFAWHYFLPDDYANLAKSALSQILLCSNLYFWKTSNYFAPTVDSSPLLHTWSLAVEEQFYIALPLLMLIVVKFAAPSKSKRNLINLLGLTAIASFFLSVILINYRRDMTFYILPTRAWELLLGGLLALRYPVSDWPQSKGNLLAMVGVVMIAYPVFFYTDQTLFPGIAALPPCVGTALLLYAHSSSDGGTLKRVLSSAPMRFVGKISYSLYLWHWPLFVFTAYTIGIQLPYRIRVILLGATLLAGWVSWRVLEKPFRKTSQSNSGPFVSKCLVASFVLAAISALTLVYRGFPNRMPARALEAYYHARSDYTGVQVSAEQAKANDFPHIGSNDPRAPLGFLLWGDSHAMALIPILDKLGKKLKVRGMVATHSATVPVIGYQHTREFSLLTQGDEFNQATLSFVKQQNIPTVFLVANWSSYSYEQLSRTLPETIQLLNKASCVPYVMLEVPGVPQNGPRSLALDALLERPDRNQFSPESYSERIRPFLDILGDREAQCHLLEPGPLLSNPSGYFGGELNGIQLYFDDRHLTADGSNLLGPLFEAPVSKSAVTP